MPRKLIAAGIILGLLVLGVSLLPSPEKCNWDFRTNLWGPANLLLQGKAPYTLEAPYGPYPSVWMPVAIGAFFWLGLLSCQVAAKFWLVLELAGLLWMLWLAAGRKLPSPPMLMAALFVIFLYPPLYSHIIYGQFTLLFCVLMMTAIFVPEARRWVPLLVALGLTKPQMAILVYPGLLLSVFHERGLNGVLRFLAQAAGWVVLLIIPLFIFHPAWPGEMWAITRMNLGLTWGFPSLRLALTTHFGLAGTLLWAALFIAALTAALWLWWAKDRRAALVWSLAMTGVVTPYIWSWDFVLMLPCLLWLLFQPGIAARATLLLGAFAVAVAQVMQRWGRTIDDKESWWIPTALLVVYLATAGVSRLLQSSKQHEKETSLDIKPF